MQPPAEARDLLCAAGLFAACLAATPLLRRMLRAATPERHRDRYLDGLRGLAAVAVLASHYGVNVIGSLGGTPTRVFHNLGTLGVQLFFALTGYLFARKALALRGPVDVGGFMAARARRIVPMYSVAIALSVLIAVLAQAGVPTSPARLLREAVALYGVGFVLDGSPTIRGLPYVEVIGTIWSLPFEWMFYVCFPLLAVLLRPVRRLAVTGAVLALYFGARMWEGRDVFTPFFLPGILAAVLPYPRLAPRGRRALIGAAAALAVGSVWPGEQNFTPVRLALMTALVLLVTAARPAALAWAPAARLGDVSYSLYLLHFPALFVTRAVLNSPAVALFAPAPRAAVFVLVAAGVTVAAGASYRWIERPFLRAAPARAPALA